MAEPLADPIGTVYRVFFEGSGTALYTAADYERIRVEYADQITRVQAFHNARWIYNWRADEWIIVAENEAGVTAEVSVDSDPEADTLPSSEVMQMWAKQQAERVMPSAQETTRDIPGVVEPSISPRHYGLIITFAIAAAALLVAGLLGWVK